jgi:hypothetical protein
MAIIEDQHDDLPDEYRPFPSIRNPNARSQIWMDKGRVNKISKMSQPEWKHRSADDTTTSDSD